MLYMNVTVIMREHALRIFPVPLLSERTYSGGRFNEDVDDVVPLANKVIPVCGSST